MYCLQITCLLSVKDFLGGQERVILCWFSTFFFKWGHPDVLSHVFFIVSSLLYNKNCYANVYAVKGRKKPTPSSRAECCDPDKALNLQKQWPCACDSTRATSYCLQHTPSCSFSATRGIITLDLLIVDFFCIGTQSEFVKQEQK